MNRRTIEDVTEVLRERLPPGWALERVDDQSGEPGLRVIAPDGRAGEISLTVLPQPDPRSAKLLQANGPLLVAAPYLSRGVREVLEGKGVSYADRTGNVRLVMDNPGLFVVIAGARGNPSPRKGRASLRGVTAGRVISTLATTRPPVGVRELATAAAANPGYVSRLLHTLDREVLVDRSPDGRVVRVDWRKLITRWSEEAPLEKRAQSSTWLAPRGLGQLADELRASDLRYAVTGSYVAGALAPIAPTRLASVYTDDPREAARALGLREATAGANVVLLEPADLGVLDRADVRMGLRVAPLPVVAADLLTGPGRSPSEAVALMDWMAAHEGEWRR